MSGPTKNTNNFQALVAEDYKDIFAQAISVHTGLDIWDEFRKYFQINSPISPQLDGRIRTELAVKKPPWYKSLLQVFRR